MTKHHLVFALTCVILTPSSSSAQSPTERQSTITYLHSLLTPNGGYLANTPQLNVRMQPTLRSTVGAIRAIRYFGGEPRHIDASARFIASCHDPRSGGFGDTPGAEPAVPTTSVAMMAVVELKMPIDKYSNGAVRFVESRTRSMDDIRIAAAMFDSLGRRSTKADEWLAEVATIQKPDGSYGDARQTGGTAAMILRLGGKIANRDAVLRVLKTGQGPEGGFGPAGKADLDSCYRIMRAFVMLKEQPIEPDRLRAFIAKCRNVDGGYGPEPGKPSTAASTYHAGIILHWLKQP